MSRLTVRLISVLFFAALWLGLFSLAFTRNATFFQIGQSLAGYTIEEPKLLRQVEQATTGSVIMGTASTEAASIRVTTTVGISPAACAETKMITVTAGTSVYFCYFVRNTGDVTLTNHLVRDTRSGLPPLSYPLPPGPLPASAVYFTRTIPIIQTTRNTMTWSAATSDGITVTAKDTATVLVPRLIITETVGTDPSRCASTSDIEVATGTLVHYCTTIYNPSRVTLQRHNVSDSLAGNLGKQLPVILARGASYSISRTQIISQSVANVITWTGYVTNENSAYATITDSAIVRTPALHLRASMITDGEPCTGGAAITVTVGTEIIYCYSVTNTGQVAFERHQLVDSTNRMIYSATTALQPGEIYDIGITLPATQSANTTYTWTAYSASNLVASSNDQTQVTVLYPLTTIVYVDVNADGQLDSLESGLPATVVTLGHATNPPVVATTDATGRVTFPNLQTGLYTVTVDIASIPTHYTLTTNNPQTVTVGADPQPLATIGFAPDPELDTDCDSISDQLEGANDDDADGIPNYLDGGCLFLPLIRR